MRRLLPVLALLPVAAILAGCGGSSSPATSTDASGCATVAKPSGGARSEPKPTTKLDPAKTYVVTFQTSCGSFAFTLDQKQSPNAAASFVALVKEKYFDGTFFHRIVPGFIIQGGDPTGTGNGGPGYTTVDTPPAAATYTHGIVAMAKTSVAAPGTAGSQFFVMTASDGLQPDYAIIGKVTSGLPVVDTIGTFGNASDEAGTPTKIVVIEKATVSES